MILTQNEMIEELIISLQYLTNINEQTLKEIKSLHENRSLNGSRRMEDMNKTLEQFNYIKE